MKKELRERIYAFNKRVKEQDDKATDLDILVAAISKLPYGQFKKLLTDDVLAVLSKYGYTEKEE